MSTIGSDIARPFRWTPTRAYGWGGPFSHRSRRVLQGGLESIPSPARGNSVPERSWAGNESPRWSYYDPMGTYDSYEPSGDFTCAACGGPITDRRGEGGPNRLRMGPW